MSSHDAVLSPDDVDRIAALARLELTAEERATFARQLADILAYANQILAVDVVGVPPTAHALVPEAAWREDEPAPGLTEAEVVANAPDAHRAPPLFRVPKVIG